MVLENIGQVGQYIAPLIDNITKGAGLVFWITLYAGGFILVAYFLYKIFLEYKIRVTIVERIGSGALNWFSDNAKIMVDKNDNSKSLVLMKTKEGRNKITTQVPAGEFRGRKGKRDHYIFFLDDNHQLQPVQPLGEKDFKHPHLSLLPEDKRWWARKEDKRRLEKYAEQSKLEKFLPSVVMITAFVMTFFIAYFGFTHLGNGMVALSSSFQQVATSCTALPV